MYTFDSRVRYSEVDEAGYLRVNALLDYFQDCTNFHSEDLGVGLKWHKEHGLMWVLNAWQVCILRYPAMGERITVGTQAYGFEKMFGYRNFLMTDGEGERIAIANSVWVLMDLHKNRPITVSEEVGSIYGKAEPLDMDYAPRKIKVAGVKEDKKDFFVQGYHLDTNHHVNNSQYVTMAMEYLPDNFLVRELRVEYKKQAVAGDRICPVVYLPEDADSGNCFSVALNDEHGKAYAVVQFYRKETEESENAPDWRQA